MISHRSREVSFGGNIPALVCTGVVTIAVGNTLGAPCLANVEGESLGVLGDVGSDIVFADTAVGQKGCIAFVVESGKTGDTGLLQTDERALGALVGTPSSCGMLVEDIRGMERQRRTSIR
jgi:hypothetical protein